MALWSHVRKKPVHVVRGAHGAYRPTLDQHAAAAAAATAVPDMDGDAQHPGGRDSAAGEPSSSGSAAPAGVGGAVAGWVGAVAVCRGSDLAASGAGDGAVRLWGLADGNKRLRPLHTLPTVSTPSGACPRARCTVALQLPRSRAWRNFVDLLMRLRCAGSM